MKLRSLCRNKNENGKYKKKSPEKKLPVFQLLRNYYNVLGTILGKMINMKIFIEILMKEA